MNVKKISTKIYSLEIPENWEFEHNNGIVSIFNTDGKGAITITSYSSSQETPNAEKALEKFVKGRGTIKRKEAKMDMAESEYEDMNKGDIFFTYAVAACEGKKLLLISYHCKKENFLKDELRIVKKIIDTLKYNN